VIWQVSVLHHSTNVYRCDFNFSASTLGPNDLTGAFRGVPGCGCAALAVLGQPFLASIFILTRRRRLPVVQYRRLRDTWVAQTTLVSPDLVFGSL